MGLFSLRTTAAYFPLWQYLNQSLWDGGCPLVLNPHKYWLHYKSEHLNRCFYNSFLEQCWQVNYPDFVSRHQDFCDRIPLEEDPVWYLSRCWQLQRCSLYYSHPENHSLEETSS